MKFKNAKCARKKVQYPKKTLTPQKQIYLERTLFTRDGDRGQSILPYAHRPRRYHIQYLRLRCNYQVT